jgi:hypothetical protein
VAVDHPVVGSARRFPLLDDVGHPAAGLRTVTDTLREHEAPGGEFPRWASVAMLDALREIQRLRRTPTPTKAGCCFLPPGSISRVEEALAGPPQD